MRRMVDRHAGSGAVLEEIRREVGGILTEMNQTTERNIELVEDSVSRLRTVIDQADRRLAILKRETEKHENSGIVYSHLSSAARPMVRDTEPELVKSDDPVKTGSTATDSVAPDTSEARRPTDGATPVHETSAPSMDNEPSESQQAGNGEGVVINDLPLKERVMGLYRQGIPIDRIASRVDTAVSEVELIVSLSERR